MKKSLLAFSTATLLAASASSFAVQPYVIGQIGQSDFDVAGDDSDTYFSIGVGFDVSKHLAFEVSYKDYGEAGDDNGRWNDDWDLEASSFSGAVVGKLPVGSSIELLGKVGLDIWEVDADNGYDDDGTDLYLGFGAAFNINTRTDITLTYEMHEFDDVDVDVLAVGINYGF